eukprot:c18382_g1_i3 orf=207-485(+)
MARFAPQCRYAAQNAIANHGISWLPTIKSLNKISIHSKMKDHEAKLKKCEIHQTDLVISSTCMPVVEKLITDKFGERELAAHSNWMKHYWWR